MRPERVAAMREVIRAARRDTGNAASYRRVYRALEELGFTAQEDLHEVMQMLDYHSPNGPYERYLKK